MTRNSTTRFFALVAAAAVSGLAMFAQTGSASAKSVLSCEGAGRQSVIECCQKIIQKRGMPLWMIQTGSNCQTSVTCYKGQRYCGITVVWDGGVNEHTTRVSEQKQSRR